MPLTTTIKVPKELGDRIAARAKDKHVSLATAIERALADADDRQFWSAVRTENANIPQQERLARVTDGTLGSDLADSADDTLSIQGGW